MKQLRSDNGGKYKSHELAKFCSERGTVQEFSPLHTSQLNGVAE